MIRVANGPALPAASDVLVYPTEESWRAARGSHGPGASECAAILGCDPHKSAWDVYSRHALGAESRIDPALARRGHREEPRVLEDYAEESGDGVLGPLRSVTVVGGGLAVSPDAFVRSGEWGGGEVKTDRSPYHWAPSGAVIERWTPDAAELVREDYATQCYALLAATGLPWWRLVVRRSLDDLRWYTLAADPVIQERLVNVVGDWWHRHIVQGQRPEIDGSEACERAWARIYGYREDRAKRKRQASDAEARLIAEHIALDDQIAALEERKRAVRSELAAAIGDGYGVERRGIGKALYIDKRGAETVDGDRLRLLHPEAWADCVRRGEPTRYVTVYRPRTP